jgi:hypothetical protein
LIANKIRIDWKIAAVILPLIGTGCAEPYATEADAKAKAEHVVGVYGPNPNGPGEVLIGYRDKNAVTNTFLPVPGRLAGAVTTPNTAGVVADAGKELIGAAAIIFNPVNGIGANSSSSGVASSVTFVEGNQNNLSAAQGGSVQQGTNGSSSNGAYLPGSQVRGGLTLTGG